MRLHKRFWIEFLITKNVPVFFFFLIGFFPYSWSPFDFNFFFLHNMYRPRRKQDFFQYSQGRGYLNFNGNEYINCDGNSRYRMDGSLSACRRLTMTRVRTEERTGGIPKLVNNLRMLIWRFRMKIDKNTQGY